MRATDLRKLGLKSSGVAPHLRLSRLFQQPLGECFVGPRTKRTRLGPPQLRFARGR